MAEATEIRIERLPVGHVAPTDFRLVVTPLPEPRPGEVRVRNEWMTLDPYMRLGLTSQEGYVAPLGPGDMLGGPAVGVVEYSTDPAFPVGARVHGQLGWRSHFVALPADAGLVLLGDQDVPPDWHLGLLGLTGVTAWIGIDRVLRPVADEVIFISGAAGAVGSIACQLARMRGARVLGSAGTVDKAAWLRDELGLDAVFLHREAGLGAFLDEYAPQGVDCYFDNVGGQMLETFLTRTRPGGRIGLCGAMSQYEQGDYRSGPANFFAVIENELRLEGFNAFRATPEHWGEAAARLKSLAQDGSLKPCHSVVQGIANVPQAFANLFDTGYHGKLVVRL